MNSQKRNGMVLFLDITKPYILIYTTNMQTQKYFFSKKEKGEKEQKASQWKIRENAFNSLKRRGVIQTSERTNFLRHHPKDRF